MVNRSVYANKELGYFSPIWMRDKFLRMLLVEILKHL